MDKHVIAKISAVHNYGRHGEGEEGQVSATRQRHFHKAQFVTSRLGQPICGGSLLDAYALQPSQPQSMERKSLADDDLVGSSKAKTRGR